MIKRRVFLRFNCNILICSGVESRRGRLLKWLLNSEQLNFKYGMYILPHFYNWNLISIGIGELEELI